MRGHLEPSTLSVPGVGQVVVVPVSRVSLRWLVGVIGAVMGYTFVVRSSHIGGAGSLSPGRCGQ